MFDVFGCVWEERPEHKNAQIFLVDMQNFSVAKVIVMYVHQFDSI